MLPGRLGLPWTRWLSRPGQPPTRWTGAVLHALGALVFVALWQVLDFASAWWFFGADHAGAAFEQRLLWRVLWRAMWGVFVYLALVLAFVLGFGAALATRSAHRAAVTAARAEASLVRAELAAISGKLNPHFLFNTPN